MIGAISKVLIADHERMRALLARARAGDVAGYDELRGALLRPPSPELLARLGELLTAHDPLEEGEGGLYSQADAALADDREMLERVIRAPTPPPAPHFAGERAFLAIDALVARAATAGAIA
jgi:hypothetical protein